MSTSILGAEAVRRALSIRDLTDPACGPHAMQQIVAACAERLARSCRCAVRERRASPIVSVADNYDRLRYPAQGVARDARYTRYVCEGAVLRTQTSAMVPALLRELAGSATGEPLGAGDLRAMIGDVVEAALPGRAWRALPTEHPYTTGGLQVDVRHGASWVEIGECGLAHPAVLEAAGLRDVAGLAMGLGLDRLLMLRKGIDDIRLLRATDPRVAAQMLDLSPYRAGSSMPPIRRDLSIVVHESTTPEELGDRVRAALGERADAIEAVAVVAETSYASLPPAARARLRLAPHQKNVLLRVVLRDVSRTLTHAEANELRDAVYAAVHEGEVHEWAARVDDRSGAGRRGAEEL